MLVGSISSLVTGSSEGDCWWQFGPGVITNVPICELGLKY